MSATRTLVRGAELEHERSGSGPDLIWGHGLSMDRVSDAAMALLRWDAIGMTVLRYDARGHGKSTSTPDLEGYSWAELARDQLALADALGIDRYVAAGASMGCGTALHAAVIAPERIRALVLVIPPTAWETRAAQTEQWQQAAHVIESQGLEAAIAARAALKPPDPFVGDPARLEQQAAATRAWEPARLAHVMRGATTADLPARYQIARLRMPALILAWTGDPAHPESTARELASLLPHSELDLASTREQMDRWTELTRAFLDKALEVRTA
jgi:pimeloyl-ACP methyl ester carboxylesterase